MRREVIISAIEDLKAGRAPRFSSEDVPAFSERACAGNEHMSPRALVELLSTLDESDIPTLERACEAMDAGELAWLGFKVVYDPASAVGNVDNEVTKKYGEVGSADGEPLLFFCNDAKEIVASRPVSERDAFQMKDVTRGPSMHNEQFDGLVWASVPLFDPVRVWLLGASDVAVELSRLAAHVGFDVVVVDYDPAYVNEERFPDATLVILDGSDFSELAAIPASSADYACVLTRGHMFDPECCVWAESRCMHYVGMMGCAGKNSTVREIARGMGMTDAQWEHVKRPIGLKFGAKTPAELAIAIVAELIDVRYRQRYDEASRERHEASLGRSRSAE